MAGQIKKMIDRVIEERAKGNPTIRSTTETKLILKGFNPSRFDAGSPDDPAVIAKLRTVAFEMGVNI
ncbi:conserved hypothetical protein [Candidatus Sulfopaludibacter sp. SbA3]|nr:conserved hypothetical protein [Candidatus Sulfopaludibacter sp. SbA3]